MRLSSTSSSSQWPRAGILAVVLVCLFDWFLLGDCGPWRSLAQGERWGPATVRVATLEVRDEPREHPRVFVMGNSRVYAGFRLPVAREQLPGLAFAKLTSAGLGPFAISSLGDEAIRARADAAVLMLSEFDTHRPVRFGTWPRPSLRAIADLVAEAGPRFALERRDRLYPLMVSRALASYSYRGLLRETLPKDWVWFTLGDLRVKRPARDPAGPIALGGGPPSRMSAASRRQVFDLFPPRMSPRWVRLQNPQLREITRGEHVAVQMGLLRRVVQRMRSSGIEVIVIEAPLHPAVADLYDTRLREEFLTFASALVSDLGARFVGLDAMQPFAESDFFDLVHVNREGSQKIIRGLATSLRAAGIQGS